ncbi:MAG TPA: hypothetical protein VNK04_07145 [Gemmataceae bacterium]|nr:hypothetical protein [Gemmataceae bacterium]
MSPEAFHAGTRADPSLPAFVRQAVDSPEKVGMLAAYRLTYPWDYILWAGLLVAVLASQLGLERVPFNNGFGWDGVIYRQLAKDWPTLLVDGKLDPFYIQRILPSGIVHYSLRLLGLPLSDSNIFNGFVVLDIVVVMAGGYFWLLCTRELALSRPVKVLSFIIIFLSFPVIKQSSFLPVLTDPTAILIGTLSLFFFLRNSGSGLCVTTLLGAFVWPTAIYVGCLLLLFPRRPQKELEADASPSPSWLRPAAVTTAAAVAFTYVLGTLLVLAHGYDMPFRAHPPPLSPPVS